VTRRVVQLDLLAKASLVGLLVFALARPDLPQFSGKAFLARGIAYPLAVLIVPAVWLAWGRRGNFPAAPDLLVTLPFLIDVVGNALNLYDTISWWDDLNHLVNWALLVAGFALLLRRWHVAERELVGLAIGFGAVTAILWELSEYLTFVRSNKQELSTAYTDTLGDLALGLTGSVVAALLVAAFARRGDQISQGA
jgi:hypothetical protein